MALIDDLENTIQEAQDVVFGITDTLLVGLNLLELDALSTIQVILDQDVTDFENIIIDIQSSLQAELESQLSGLEDVIFSTIETEFSELRDLSTFTLEQITTIWDKLELVQAEIAEIKNLIECPHRLLLNIINRTEKIEVKSLFKDELPKDLQKVLPDSDKLTCLEAWFYVNFITAWKTLQGLGKELTEAKPELDPALNKLVEQFGILRT